MTADGQTKTYGERDPALTYQITGGRWWPATASPGALTRAAGENVGAYAIEQGTLALSANYALTYMRRQELAIGDDGRGDGGRPDQDVWRRDPALTYQVTAGRWWRATPSPASLTRGPGERSGRMRSSRGRWP